jgi:hypothetical protein
MLRVHTNVWLPNDFSGLHHLLWCLLRGHTVVPEVMHEPGASLHHQWVSHLLKKGLPGLRLLNSCLHCARSCYLSLMNSKYFSPPDLLSLLYSRWSHRDLGLWGVHCLLWGTQTECHRVGKGVANISLFLS